MKNIGFLLRILIIFFVISCTKKSNEYDISFQEQSFANDILATISILNDSVYVVGGEDGEIYLLQDDSVIADYKPDLARIYSLFIDNDTLYAGVRNNGIVKLVKNNAVKQYNIPQKETRYSPYNIIPYRGDTLLTTTSNGLYYFSKGKPNNLSPIQYVENPGEPFPFCSPITIGKNIFVGSKKGIIAINTLNDKPKAESLFNGKLNNIVISKLEKGDNDTIYALSDEPGNDTLYICNIKSNIITKSYGLSFSARSFVIAEGKFYFINEHELHVITNLDDLDNLKKEGNHVVIRLPHASSPDARNIIIYDKTNRKIRIITQKTLLSLPSLNGIGESKSKISGICFDEKSKTIYFQNANNEIYKYKYEKGSKIKASKILELPLTEEVSSLSAFDGTLYFISNYQQLKSIKDKGYLQSLWNHPSSICDLPDKSTAMLVDDSVAYVGVRDCLLKINLTEKRIDKLLTDHDVKPYVTNITKHENNLVANTLNDGTFILCNDTLNKDVQFQCDFAFTNVGFLLLNNHYLFNYHNNQIDTIPFTGYERLLLSSDSVGAIVHKNGIQYFQIENEVINLLHNESRHISPNACMIIGDSLFLAADEGMLIVNLEDFSTSPVKFNHAEYAWTETVATIAIIIIILLVLLWIVKKRQFAQKLKRRIKEVEKKYNEILSQKETLFRKEEENVKRQYSIQLQQKEEEHKSVLSKLEQDYKDNEDKLKHDIESEKIRYNKEIQELELLVEKEKAEYDKNRTEEKQKIAVYLENEIVEIEAAIKLVDESLEGNSDYNDIANTILECKRLVNPGLLYALDVSKINEITKKIQISKVRLNEMLIISLNKIWEKVSRYCNKDKGIADTVRKAVNDGDLNARIEQIKKCEEYMDKINIIKKYKAISSLNFDSFCNDIKKIVQPFDDALENDKGVDWESLIEEIFHCLCDMKILKEELKDGINNLEQEIKITLLYIEQIKQKEIELSADLAKRLIDDSERIIEIRNSIQFDESKWWNNISGDENAIGKALIDNLEELSNDIHRITERKDFVSCLMSIVALNDRKNMFFLLILINGMIECYHKEKGPRFQERQKMWSELINNSIYQFFLMVNEHGTDKKILLDFGGKEIITNHVRWNKEKGKKDGIPMVTYPYKILALTLALGKIISNKNKQELKDYLDSPTSWYKEYTTLTDKWKEIKKRTDYSLMQNDPSCVIIYYLRKLVL